MKSSRGREESARETVRHPRKWFADESYCSSLSDGKYRIEILSTTLETKNQEEVVVTRFREKGRPKCIFEFDMEATEPRGGENSVEYDPETWASIVYTNLEEQILAVGHGLPEQCDPERINRI